MFKIKNKKLLLGLSAVVATSTIAVTAVACSGEVNAKIETLSTINPKPDADLKAKIGTKKFADLGKMVLITDNGSIDDKSFNQSTWDAVRYTARQIGLITGEDGAKNIQSLKPDGKDEGQYEAQYDIALAKGYKYWVLPGFTHNGKIQNYWNKPEKKAALEKLGVIIIGVDFNPNSKSKTDAQVPAKYSISLDFKTEEAGFIVGYGAAKYVGEGSSTDKKLYTFGGFDGSSVTDFIRGFLSGAKLYNDGAEKAKRVQIANPEVDLTSGFSKDDVMTGAVNKSVLSKAEIILPVAGPATELVAAALAKDANNKSLIIGVDVDQSKAISASKDKFFSSIEKRLSQAVYDALTNLYLENTAEMPAEGKPIVKRNGLAENWVGYSPSTLPGEEKTKADAALKAGKDYWEKAENKATIKATLQEDAAFNNGVKNNLNALVKAINDKFNAAS